MLSPALRVSQAESTDIPALCELLGLLFEQEAEFMPDRQRQAEGLCRIIGGDGVGDVLVAREAGRPIAMVSLLYTVSTAMGRRVALLEDMVVVPEARRRGVGSQLLQHAIDLARVRGCGRITLLTDGDNLAAQAFYRAHGFASSTMLPMRLDLEA